MLDVLPPLQCPGERHGADARPGVVAAALHGVCLSVAGGGARERKEAEMTFQIIVVILLVLIFLMEAGRLVI